MAELNPASHRIRKLFGYFGCKPLRIKTQASSVGWRGSPTMDRLPPKERFGAGV